MKYGDDLYQAILGTARSLKKLDTDGDFDRALLLADARCKGLETEMGLIPSPVDKKTGEVFLSKFMKDARIRQLEAQLDEKSAALAVATEALEFYKARNHIQLYSYGYTSAQVEIVKDHGERAQIALSQTAISRAIVERQAMEEVIVEMRIIGSGRLRDGTVVEGRIVELAEEILANLDRVRKER